MFNKWKRKRRDKRMARYLNLKTKWDAGASFPEGTFNTFIDLEIEFNALQEEKKRSLNVVPFKDSDSK